MPTLAANLRVIEKAIKGGPAVYSIDGHDGLYLDVRGEGRATWRLRYRPRPKANQRWFRLANQASIDQFGEVSAKARMLMADLRLKGIDPAENKPGVPNIEVEAPQGLTIAECYAQWGEHTGKRRKRGLSAATRASYDGLYKLHVAPHVGGLSIDRLDRGRVRQTLECQRRSNFPSASRSNNPSIVNV